MAHDILVIDDEADIRMAINGILSDEGYAVREAGDSDRAMEAIRQRRPNLVILDIWLKNSRLDGMDLLKAILNEYPGLPVVMISGHGTIELAVNAIRCGAYEFIEKPFKADRLLLVVQRAVEASRLKMEVEELRQRAGPATELLGRSIAINQVRQVVEKVAPTGSRVFITGPAGVGKEVVARLIHERSPRASGSFVALNCATMHPDRLECELFGTEPGVEGPDPPGKTGTVERAHGGTLLLDEVADMPVETQGKIVRVLQEQTFLRVGGQRQVEVDVRVIASSNRNLPELIHAGKFREDLFYRLNVVPLRVPALRERREDVPLLIDHFINRSAELGGLPPRQLSEEAVATLQAYDWPGNVRQLRNVVDWILIMAPGAPDDPVNAEVLPSDIDSIAPSMARDQEPQEIMSLPLREAREVFERRYLEAQVARFGGNISRTAAFVGMERSALHRKLRTLGLSAGERH